MKKNDYSKYIGYILFIVSVIGWGFSAGKFYSKLENLEKDLSEVNIKLKQQQQLLLEQQKFNGSVLTYIEMKEKEDE